MIARTWSCRAPREKVADYVKHFEERAFLVLRRFDGYRGAYVLQRLLGDEGEILVLTLWDSMLAVRTFAGDEPNATVMEDDAKVFLSQFDSSVEHFELVFGIVETHLLGRS